MEKYSYSKLCDSDRLSLEIANSAIVTALDHIQTTSSPENTDVWFKAILSPEDELVLDDLVDNHENTPLPAEAQEMVISDGSGNRVNQLDTDNALIVRPKAAKKGWSFWAVPIEFTTSALSSIHCKDASGSDIPGITCKIYDGSGVEITTPGLLDINLGTCVKTVVDFEPAFDYEMIGGSLRINSNPAVDMRLWIVGAPDIPAIYGGSKEFASGINLKFMAPDSSFEIDGRVSKYVTYNSSTHQGKLRVLLKHPPGMQVNIQVVIHAYRL